MMSTGPANQLLFRARVQIEMKDGTVIEVMGEARKLVVIYVVIHSLSKRDAELRASVKLLVNLQESNTVSIPKFNKEEALKFLEESLTISNISVDTSEIEYTPSGWRKDMAKNILTVYVVPYSLTKSTCFRNIPRNINHPHLSVKDNLTEILLLTYQYNYFNYFSFQVPRIGPLQDTELVVKGEGKTKKEAEKEASFNACMELEVSLMFSLIIGAQNRGLLKIPLAFKKGSNEKESSETCSPKEAIPVEITPVKRKSTDIPASIFSQIIPILDKSTFFIVCNKCGHSLCPVSQAEVSNQHIIITGEQVIQ